MSYETQKLRLNPQWGGFILYRKMNKFLPYSYFGCNSRCIQDSLQDIFFTIQQKNIIILNVKFCV